MEALQIPLRRADAHASKEFLHTSIGQITPIRTAHVSVHRRTKSFMLAATVMLNIKTKKTYHALKTNKQMKSQPTMNLKRIPMMSYP
jgi:hypothetical protein